MLKTLKQLTYTILLTAVVAPLCVANEVVVIANHELPVTSLSQNEIERIYLGKTKFLSNGVKVIPVDQSATSPVREKFYTQVIRKTDAQMKAYWARSITSGHAYPPVQERDDQSVKVLVATNPNCIGYIDKSALDETVKVIYTLP